MGRIRDAKSASSPSLSLATAKIADFESVRNACLNVVDGPFDVEVNTGSRAIHV
jgi:hypothetical protein